MVTDRRHVARIPAGWSFAQAAAVPIAFLTAYRVLTELAGLSAGYREVAAFNDEPYAHHWFEKVLAADGSGATR